METKDLEFNGVKIGDRFYKQLSARKQSLCEVVHFIERKNLVTGKVIEVEVWAKSIDNVYAPGQVWQTSYTTIKKNPYKPTI